MDLIELNSLGGSIVLLSYCICLTPILSSDKGKDWAWAGISGIIRKIYTISMIITAISYIYLVFNMPSTQMARISFIIFLIGASCWTPALLATYGFPSSEMYAYCVIVALCLTSIGALMLLYQIWKQNLSWKYCVTGGIVVFHILLLDNIIWGGRWFLLQN